MPGRHSRVPGAGRVLTLLLALAPLGAAGCSGSDGGGCPDRFDTQAWRGAAFNSDERRSLAGQVKRCGFLRGADKARVRKLLGPADREPALRSARQWSYPVGETNGEYGPADEQFLSIGFDKRGRVKWVEL